jgi:CBS domain containing-hemolysin-like protein
VAWQIIAALILVGANGFFVAVEFSVARLRPTQVEDFIKAGRPGAKSARHAVDNIDAYLAACQLGITLSSLGLGALGEPAFHHLLEPLLGDSAKIFGWGLSGLVAFLIITVLHVVFGELAPKSLGIARTGGTALLLTPLMRIFYFALKPFVDAFNWMGNIVLRPFGVPPAREAASAPHSEYELRQLLRQSGEEGEIDRGEQEFAERVFLFADRRAREILVPRGDIVYLTTEDSLRSALDKARETGFTRFPLCEPDGGLDEEIGLIHVKDLLDRALDKRDVNLRDLARPLPRVSESMLADALLRDLRRARQHLALVVDEHGTVIGLVTIEDIIEELVGEIEDEFDPDREEPIRRENGSAIVAGSASVYQIGEQLEIHFPDAHEATVGGYILEQLGRLPEVGEVLEIDGHRVEITKVGEANIDELRLDLEPIEDDDDDDGDRDRVRNRDRDSSSDRDRERDRS